MVDAFSRFAAAVRAVPGVASVAVTGAPPLSAGADQSGVRFPTSPTNTGNADHDKVLADNAPITAGYLKTMGVALLEGREFDGSETDTTLAKIAVIDELTRASDASSCGFLTDSYPIAAWWSSCARRSSRSRSSTPFAERSAASTRNRRSLELTRWIRS